MRFFTLILLSIIVFTPVMAQEEGEQLPPAPETRMRGWRNWRLEGWPQENGKLVIAFTVESEEDYSSDKLFYGCGSTGPLFIGFDNLPYGSNKQVVIEIDGELVSHVGVVVTDSDGRDDLLIIRDDNIIEKVVENNDEVFAYVGRTVAEARTGEGEREFDIRGIDTVHEWLPRFCIAAGN